MDCFAALAMTVAGTFGRLRPFHVKRSGDRLETLPASPATQIGRKDAECGRGQAVEPTRLPHGARPGRRKLRARLIGKAGHASIIDIGQDQSLVAPEGIDVGSLALEVDVIFGVDLEVDGDRWINGGELRPDS